MLGDPTDSLLGCSLCSKAGSSEGGCLASHQLPLLQIATRLLAMQSPAAQSKAALGRLKMNTAGSNPAECLWSGPGEVSARGMYPAL